MKYGKYALIGLLMVAVLLTIIVSSIGSMMNPTQRVSRWVKLQVPADSLYAVISDFKDAATWRSDLLRVEMLPSNDTLPRWREFDRQHNNWAFEAVEMRPPTKLKIKIAEPEAPVQGTWAIEITPLGKSSLVIVTEVGVVDHVLYRFFSRIFYDKTTSLDAYLTSLAARFDIPDPEIS